MKLLKRILPLILVLVAAMSLALVSCGDGGDGEGGAEPCTHTYGEFAVVTEATCTADGLKTKTCSACGNAVSEKIDALGHTAPNADGACQRCGTQLGAYSVTVNDKDGAPIKEATVMLFINGNTQIKTAGADGKVSFDADSGALIFVQVTQLPEGYGSMNNAAGMQQFVGGETSKVIDTGAEKLVRYTLTVLDENGAAVSGLTAQICYTETCKPSVTDGNGQMYVYFTPAEAATGLITAKIPTPPQGYTYASDASGYVSYGAAFELTIILVAI